MPLVGRLLKGYIIDALTSQTVLEMLRNGEVGKLRAILESSKEAEELHGKWERLS
jgi:serine/threonine-protein kinase RIO1